MNPLVSIVIPVYNGENYLCDAIDSALAQTYPNVEVIVVNDGSTDDTEKLCLSYGDKIRYFKKDNGGVSSALNLGIKKMRGDYFSWLSHDDVYYPNKIERNMDALNQCGDMQAIVFGNWDLLNVNFGDITPIRAENFYEAEQITNSVFPVLFDSMLHICTLLIHKCYFEYLGLFDEKLRYTQDMDFVFRLFRGKRTIFDKEPLMMSRLMGAAPRIYSKSFSAECEKLFEFYANEITIDEIKNFGFSPSAFYFNAFCRLRCLNAIERSEEMRKKILSLPEELFDNTQLLKRLFGISEGKSREVCIFGAGFMGRILNMELSARNIKVRYFCDNDMQKHGKKIGGTYCISPKELEQDKNNLLVIISNNDFQGVYKQLKEIGINHIEIKRKLDVELWKCPPDIKGVMV